MQPAGCFGSSLAFDENAKACIACPARDECGAKVEARHPAMIRLLSRFHSASDGTMAVAWMTPSERKELREQERVMRYANIFKSSGSATRLTALRDKLKPDQRKVFDAYMEDRIDVFTASTDEIGKSSPIAAIIFSSIAAGPCPKDEIIARIISARGLSGMTAQIYFYRHVAVLVGAGRIRQTPKTVEIL